MSEFLSMIERNDNAAWREEIQAAMMMARHGALQEHEVAALLRHACREGDLEMVDYLLSQNDLSHYSFLAFSSAVRRNQVAVVKLLLNDIRMDPTIRQCQVVRQASEYGFKVLVDIFLQDDRVVTSGGHQAAFDGAAAFGSLALFEELICLDTVDPSSDENHAIRSAAKRNDTRMIQLLLQNPSVDPSAKKNDALVTAACLGHEPAVDLLVADARIYINGMIPVVSQQQTLSYLTNSVVASNLIQKSAMRLLATGEQTFDVAKVLSKETLDKCIVKTSLQNCHDRSLILLNEAVRCLDALSEDVIVEILWTIWCYSFYPWLPANERKAELKRFVTHSRTW